MKRSIFLVYLDLDSKEDLAKSIAKVNQTEEPTFIIKDFKPEAVLLSYKSYEKIRLRFIKLPRGESKLVFAS